MLNTREFSTPIQNKKDTQPQSKYENISTPQNPKANFHLSFDDHQEIIKCLNSIKKIILQKSNDPNHHFAKGTSNVFTFQSQETDEQCNLFMLLSPQKCPQVMETIKALGDVNFIDLDTSPSKVCSNSFLQSPIQMLNSKECQSKQSEEFNVSMNRFLQEFDEHIGNSNCFDSKIHKDQQNEIQQVHSTSNPQSSKGSKQINEIELVPQHQSTGTIAKKGKFIEYVSDSDELDKGFVQESFESNPQGNILESSKREEHKNQLQSSSFDINTSQESAYQITCENNSTSKRHQINTYQKSTTRNVVYRDKILNENSKSARVKKQWEDYLRVLSHAQTELTYLCQFMNWNFRFIQNLTKTQSKKFCCKIEVIVMVNDVPRKYEGLCESARNKKSSRHQASLICLYRMYSSVNGLWEKFSRQKQKNPCLCRELTQNNVDIIDVLLNKSSSVPKKWDLEDKSEQIFPDVDTYLSTLQNYKRELNLFVGQFNRVFMTPQWQVKPPNNMNYWEVEGYVRFELNSKIYECRYKNKGENKRDCEQNISKAILVQLFNQFPNMYTHFRKIKMQRGLT